MRILLLSAYDAVSHVYWRKGLVENFPEHQWTVLSLPGRHFAWRIRGNSLSWAFSERDVLQQSYDLIIATSMTDLSALKGMVPELAAVPTVVYFHENQFAYPESEHQFDSVESRILNLYTALAADQIAFNSEFNRQTFLDGVAGLLAKMPDQVPPGVVQHLQRCSRVLPVPLEQRLFLENAEVAGPLQLVWNHRWEYDKGPELLLAAVKTLKGQGAEFVLHVVGQQFTNMPAEFDQIKALIPDQIGHWGYMPSAEAYYQLLQQADVVLSTAHHDYQGIAVLEGVAAGCLPLVPDRLAYRELFPEYARYHSGGDKETREMVRSITYLSKAKKEGALPEAPDIRSLSWCSLASAYQELMMDAFDSRGKSV